MEGQNDIKFSIVIPAFNAAGCIEDALASCLRQSYTNYEIIVVDDASTDATASILQNKYAQQVRYVRLSTNKGSAAARNAGLDIASGTYIAFLDADDVWHTDKLQVMHSILVQRPDILFLYHPYTVAGRDDAALTGAALMASPALHELSFARLLLRNAIATPCVVMRNKQEFRFEERMRHTEDYDLWVRIRYRHPIYFIDLPLTVIGRPVLSKGGLSAARWKMRLGELHAYLRLARLNVLFIFLFPFLFIFSLLKYVRKMITGV